CSSGQSKTLWFRHQPKLGGLGVRSFLHSTQMDSGTTCSAHQSSFSCLPLPVKTENFGMVQLLSLPHTARPPSADRTIMLGRARRSGAADEFCPPEGSSPPSSRPDFCGCIFELCSKTST